MHMHDLQKLLIDVEHHYQKDIGEHFAKAISRMIMEERWEKQKEELLLIISLLVDLKKDD